jgi:putative ABC transport system permease protein
LGYGLLPFFSDVVGTPILIGRDELTFIPMLLLGALLIGVVAGLYPALYLSSFRPTQILYGRSQPGVTRSTLRSVLVVCQYTISIALIIGTLVIKRQMSYMMTKELGFDKDQVLVLQNTHNLGERTAAFKHDLQRLAGIGRVSVSGFLPIAGTRRNGSGMWKGVKGLTADGIDTQQWTVDEDYIKTLGLHLLEGRNFNPALASDAQAMIVNQKLVQSMGIKDPIGQVIVNPWQSFTIIGVVGDFHFESMRQDIGAIALVLGNNTGAVSVKLNTRDTKTAVAQVASLWKKYEPEQPMRYTFLDDGYTRMYDDLRRMDDIMSAFALLAIIVASLGLFALSAYTVEQRTREISIRRVLGATTGSIVNLLTGNFITLVAISFVLAAPVAWYVMKAWLQDYAYKTDLGWDVFIIACLIAFVLAIGTISMQAVKAALKNPAQNLRSM